MLVFMNKKINFYEILFSKSSRYIFITLFTSFISILKNYVFMRIFPLKDIGIVSFMQSIIMLIGFTQLGLLNGGYRLISKSNNQSERINSFIFSYNSYLFILVVVVVLMIDALFGIKYELSLVYFSILAAFVTVLANWVSNLYIAEQKLGLLNKLNVISLFVSFLPLIFFQISSIWSGIMFVTSQSFIFILFAFYWGKYKFYFMRLDRRMFVYILSVGFVPFLLNIVGGVFMLFERWIIKEDLGVESLGSYYLVFAYTMFFQIVPTALNNIVFPVALRSTNKKTESYLMVAQFKSYFIKLVGYSIIMGFLTYFLSEPLIQIFLPQYLSSIGLVKIVFWGLLILNLSQPFMLIFQIKMDFKKLLLVYALASIITLICYYILVFRQSQQLEVYASLNCLNNVLISLIAFCVFYFAKIRKLCYLE